MWACGNKGPGGGEVVSALIDSSRTDLRLPVLLIKMAQLLDIRKRAHVELAVLLHAPHVILLKSRRLGPVDHARLPTVGAPPSHDGVVQPQVFPIRQQVPRAGLVPDARAIL